MGKVKLLLVLIIGIMTLGLASIGIDVAAVEPSTEDIQSSETTETTTEPSGDSIQTVWRLSKSQDVYDLAEEIARSNGEAFTVTVENDITIEYLTTGTGSDETENFKGLGSVDRPFIGTFEGGGHTITLSGTYGLFAVAGDVHAETKTTTIQDVKVATAPDKEIFRGIDIVEGSMTGCLVCVAYNSTIEGCENLAAAFSKNGLNAINAVGGLVGYAENSTIKNCINQSASSDNKRLEYFGGIVGWAKNSTIENCSNAGALEGATETSTTCSGGIVGYLDNSTVRGCSNTGVLSGHDTIGGIVGWADKLCSIENCSNAADLTGDDTVAGIVGLASGSTSGTADDAVSIKTSYNLGTITGNGYDSGDYAAGIVGSAGNESTIASCYNLGTISNTNTSENTKGKIAGIVGSSAGSITNCYNLGSIVMEHENSSAYAAGIVAELKGTPSINSVYHAAQISTGGSVQAAPIVFSVELSSTTINNAYYVDTNAIFGESEYYGTKATIQEFSADQIEAFQTDAWVTTGVGLYPKLASVPSDATNDFLYVPFAYLPTNDSKNVLQLGQAQEHIWNYYAGTRNMVGGNTALTDGLEIDSITIAIDDQSRFNSKESTLIEFIYPFGLDTESMKEETFTWHDAISINLEEYKLEREGIICTYETSNTDYQIEGTTLSYVGTDLLDAGIYTCDVTVKYGDWERTQSIQVEVVPREFSITDFTFNDTVLTSVADTCLTDAIVYESSDVLTEKNVDSTVWTKGEDYTISHSYNDNTKKTTTTVTLPEKMNSYMTPDSTGFSYSYEIQEVFKLDPTKTIEYTFSEDEDFEVKLEDYSILSLLEGHVCSYTITDNDDFEVTQNIDGAYLLSKKDNTGYLDAGTHEYTLTMTSNAVNYVETLEITVNQRELSITDFKLDDIKIDEDTGRDIFEKEYVNDKTSVFRTVTSDIFADTDYTVTTQYVESDEIAQITITPTTEGNATITDADAEGKVVYDYNVTNVPYFTEDTFEVTWGDSLAISLDEIREGGICNYVLEGDSLFVIDNETHVLSFASEDTNKALGEYECSITLDCGDFTLAKTIVVSVVPRQMFCTDFTLDEEVYTEESAWISGIETDVAYDGTESSLERVIDSEIWTKGIDYRVTYDLDVETLTNTVTITPSAQEYIEADTMPEPFVYTYGIIDTPEISFEEDTYETDWGNAVSIDLVENTTVEHEYELGCNFILDDEMSDYFEINDENCLVSSDILEVGTYPCNITVTCGIITKELTFTVEVGRRSFVITDFIVDGEVFETEAEFVAALEQSFNYQEQDDIWQKVITSQIWHEGTDYAVEYAFDRLTYKATLTIKVLETNETASETATDLVYVYDVVCPYEFTQPEEPYVYEWQDVIALDLAIECGENTYTLLDATEENDNALFEIAGTTLQVKEESGDLLPNTYVCDVMITRGRFDKLIQVEVCVEKVAFELADFSLVEEEITQAVIYNGTEDSLYKEITSDRWDDREDYTLDMVFDEDTWETTIRIIPKLPSPYISDDAKELTYVYKVNVPDFIELYLNAGEEYSFPRGMDSVYFGTPSDGCVYSSTFEQFFVRQTGTYRFRASEGGVS